MNVTQVIVGHDVKEAGQGWFVHRVCVRVANGDTAGSYWMFPCDRHAALQSFFITVIYICIADGSYDYWLLCVSFSCCIIYVCYSLLRSVIVNVG